MFPTVNFPSCSWISTCFSLKTESNRPWFYWKALLALYQKYDLYKKIYTSREENKTYKNCFNSTSSWLIICRISKVRRLSPLKGSPILHLAMPIMVMTIAVSKNCSMLFLSYEFCSLPTMWASYPETILMNNLKCAKSTLRLADFVYSVYWFTIYRVVISSN